MPFMFQFNIVATTDEMENSVGPPVAKGVHQRRTVKRPQGSSSNTVTDNLECQGTGTDSMISLETEEVPIQAEGYLSQESHGKLVSRISQLEGRVSKLAEKNHQQAHEIQTLRGSNFGLEEGTTELRSQVGELQEKLYQAELYIAKDQSQLDQSEDGDGAEICARRDEAHARSRENDEERTIRNHSSSWMQLFQAALSRQESDADNNMRLRKKCGELEHAYQKLAYHYDQREHAFEAHLRQVNNNMDELTAHCSNLAKQSGLRRAYVPIEDESEVLDAFRQLNVAVRYWCLAAWDLKPEDATIQFDTFPLARKDDMCYNTDEVWVLIACMWEWLMKRIFGTSSRSDQVLDFWIDEDIAEKLQSLERHIVSIQKADVIHEWRSFTVQCLLSDHHKDDMRRVDEIISDIADWLLPMLKRDDKESSEIEKLIEELRIEVMKPAIALQVMLRKRYTPIIIGTPMTVDSMIRKWSKARLNGKSTEPLEIVTVPELRKVHPDTALMESHFEVLLEAQTYVLVERTDSSSATASEEEEDDVHSTPDIPPHPYVEDHDVRP